jgi:hypothetical protein
VAKNVLVLGWLVPAEIDHSKQIFTVLMIVWFFCRSKFGRQEQKWSFLKSTPKLVTCLKINPNPLKL